MGTIWDAAGVGRLEFAASATLLALTAKQKSLAPGEPPLEDSDDESQSHHDEGDDFVTSRPTPGLTTYNRDALIDDFLDRLAEVFSREKSSPQSRDRQDSKHIAATAWIKQDSETPLTILFAKNEGSDDLDLKLTCRLQLWLRVVARTGRIPSIVKDTLWNGDLGLIEYSRRRLSYHLSQFIQLGRSVDALADQSDAYGPTVQRLQCLCHKATIESTVQQLSDIVNVAHDLRFVWIKLRNKEEHTKTLRCINMLRRLRAAYELFKSVALTFDEIVNVEIQAVNLHNPLNVNGTRFRKHLQKLAEGLRLPKGLLKRKNAHKLTTPSKLFVHAEMQILVSLARNADWFRRSHRYIGASKKPCYLCGAMLENYRTLSIKGAQKRTFRARRSHRKVYPLWTLPQQQILTPAANFAIATATALTHEDVRQLLGDGPTMQAAIAESSAGVTSTSSLPGRPSETVKRYLDDQRVSHASKAADELGDPIILGRKVKTVQVGLLPVNGSKPTLVPIAFYALPEKADRRVVEIPNDLVPSFHKSWGPCQHNRRYRLVDLQNQLVKEWEGEYRLYWNENPELPENESIKNFLGIQTVNHSRRFWYGDVYIVRCTEQYRMSAYDVYDIPTTIFEYVGWRNIFQDMWEDSFLEKQLQGAQYSESSQEKIDADKELIFQRMTIVQKEILSRSTEGTLEMLALTACDDGAMGNVSIESIPDDQTMLRITTLVERTALEVNGWEEFCSAHL